MQTLTKHTRTKPNLMITEPPIDIPDEYPNPTPGGPPPPESVILACACGTEATMFPFASRPTCYGCAFPQAATLQILAIKATMARNRVCANCSGAHVTWQCPQIAEANAPAVYPTADVVRLWGTSREALTITLGQLTPAQLLCQALDFAAWLNDKTKAGLKATSVLHVWQEMIAGAA